MFKHLSILCLTIILSVSATAQNNSINIKISGIKKIKGNLLIAFYDNSDNFLKEDKSVYNKIVKVKSHEETLVLKNIKLGSYAVAVIHDANANGVLDTNFFGIPTELYGTSNNIRNMFGAPSFKDAKFFYNGTLQELHIILH